MGYVANIALFPLMGAIINYSDINFHDVEQ